jgi:transcriptional regulator with XRE-family HTH domain
MVSTVKRRNPSAAAPGGTKPRRVAAGAAANAVSPSMLTALARQLQSWTGSILGNVGAATDLSLWAAKNKVQAPAAKAAVGKTQSLLRELRQIAGLTRNDLNKALELEDRSFISLVEDGQVAALPFDLILRLAAILGRGDPMTFILQMTRVYNPKTWKTLEALGVGKLFVQAGREREFANIYRGHDAARDLSDQDFVAALGFTRTAFETALAFRAKGKRTPKPKGTISTALVK